MAAEASSGKLRKGAIDVDEMLKNLSEAEKECVFLAKAVLTPKINTGVTDN